MLRVDLQKIEQQLAAMIASQQPSIEGTEPNNVLARLQVEVVPAFIRWKAGEMNRGIEQNSVLNALVCFISSSMVGTIGEVVGSAEVSDAHFQLANSLLQAIGEEVGAILTGERDMDAFHVRNELAN